MPSFNTAIAAANTVVDAAQFHPLHGHVAEGVVIRFSNGATRSVANTLRGWTLADGAGQQAFSPLAAAVDFTAMVIHMEAFGCPDGIDVPVPEPVPLQPLTARETEVLQCAANGSTLPAIGRVLNVSFFSIAAHLNSICRKLGVSTLTQATNKAQRLGLIGKSC